MGEVAVVTNIGLEHTEILGHTRAAIAGEKVGILKPGAALVTSLDANDEAGRVLEARAETLGAPVVRPPLAASPTIEGSNVALAGAVLDQLGKLGVRAPAVGDADVGAWLIDANVRAAARLPGRMERFAMETGSGRLAVVLDGAHVPFNIEAVLDDLARSPEFSEPCVAVVALAADKDAKGFVAELGKRASTIVFSDLPGSSRGRPPDELQRLAASLGLNSEAEPDARRALNRATALTAAAKTWLLVTGSLYLVGALRGAVIDARRR